jgi:hypothetical protein
MPSLFRRRTVEIGPSATDDDLREQRLDDIKKLAERFTYDLGLLIAGHPVELETYVAPGPAQRLIASLEPFLASGDAMRPNFGEYGELRVEGDLLNTHDAVRAHIEFDDQSVRETSSGDLIPIPRRRMLLTLIIDPSCRNVQEYDLRPVPQE